MHPHLHTKDTVGCEQAMANLEECHARGFLYRAVGMCNEAKNELNKCLKEERMVRIRANRAKAQEKQARIREVWREIDENS